MVLLYLFSLDKYSKETTVINQIFGGFLRSQGKTLLNLIALYQIDYTDIYAEFPTQLEIVSIFF